MKPNESNKALEPERHDAELPELAVRILSDFARIVAAEARLLESNFVEAANALVGRVYISAILIVLAAGGVVALLASLVFLLHHWMPWWQVLGLVGVCAILLAEVLRRTLIPSPSAASVSVVSPS
jgi:Putative Actinobacterial Holin-X, holin superfamily III